MAGIPPHNNTGDQDASHPFGIDPPDADSKIDPPLRVGNNVTTTSWRGKTNQNKLFVNLTDNSGFTRFTTANEINSYWPGVPVTLWFPKDLQPQGLPSNPLDWSGDYIDAFRALAEKTEGNVERAHGFLKKVAVEKAGSENLKLGSADVWAAYELCVADDGATAAMGRLVAQRARWPSATLIIGAAIVIAAITIIAIVVAAMIKVAVAGGAKDGGALEIDDKPCPGPQSIFGASTAEEPNERLQHDPVGFPRD